MYLKSKLRKVILGSRSEVAETNTQNACEKIFDFLVKNGLLSLSIGLYYPMKGEIGLLNYLMENEKWLKKDVKMSLPVIINSDIMFFANYKFHDHLVRPSINVNLYNPLYQPDSDIEEFPDIIILPGLGLSCKGYRLGFGMGHYDKYFARLTKLGKKFITIGLISHKNLFLSLPFDENDHRLDYIITDKIFIKIDGHHNI